MTHHPSSAYPDTYFTDCDWEQPFPCEATCIQTTYVCACVLECLCALDSVSTIED